MRVLFYEPKNTLYFNFSITYMLNGRKLTKFSGRLSQIAKVCLN